MPKEHAASGVDGRPEEPQDSPRERRRSRRRRLPFRRGAILESAVCDHLVAVMDLSVNGAYLATRASVFPGQTLSLKLMLVLGGVLRLACEVVRVCPHRAGPDAYPPGVAVRFLDVPPAAQKRLGAFVGEGVQTAR